MTSNLKKYALLPTTIHHLRDGNDELMFADGPDGQPDKTKPMQVHLQGPGTKTYAKAKAAASNRAMDRFKKKGKSDQSAEDAAEETASFIAACTTKFENIEIDQLEGEALYKAAYTDQELCFIPAQLDKVLGDFANFTKVPQPT